MNSPGPIAGGFPPGHAPVRDPGPGPGRAAVVWRAVLTVVLAAVSLGSLGMLSVVPMVWLAAVGRRAWDWIGCGLVAVTSGAGFVLAAQSNGDNDWQGSTGVPLLLCSALGVALYVPIVDWRRQRAARAARAAAAYPPFYPYPPYSAAPYPATPYPYPTPLPPLPSGRAAAVGGSRIEQVRAELDELSDYLRSQGEGT